MKFALRNRTIRFPAFRKIEPNSVDLLVIIVEFARRIAAFVRMKHLPETIVRCVESTIASALVVSRTKKNSVENVFVF